jgi:hypothetical protein
MADGGGPGRAMGTTRLPRAYLLVEPSAWITRKPR